MDDAATSCLTPIYTTITDVPECVKVGNGNLLTYSPTSLFWLTNRVAHMAYLMYDRVAPDIQAVADKFENTCIDEQSRIDAQALEILDKATTKEEGSANVRRFLTAYSTQRAQHLFNTWQGLDTYFLVKYMDGNVKRQNEDGTFKNNGHSPAIPASPAQPGYSQKWKEAVAKDAGEILKAE